MGGCATLSRQAFTPPVVTVQDVRLAGIGLQGGRIDVHVSLYNPNGYRLDASTIRYRVLVDTLQLAAGTIEEDINLGRRDSTQLRFPVNFGLRETIAASNLLAAKGTLPFELEGDLRVLTPFGAITRPFRQRGTYDGVNISILPR
jgi:LEA14-like dessication related protein